MGTVERGRAWVVAGKWSTERRRRGAWDQMDFIEVDALRSLGWTAASWNEGRSPADETIGWEELDQKQRFKAAYLGLSRQAWANMWRTDDSSSSSSSESEEESELEPEPEPALAAAALGGWMYSEPPVDAGIGWAEPKELRDFLERTEIGSSMVGEAVAYFDLLTDNMVDLWAVGCAEASDWEELGIPIEDGMQLSAAAQLSAESVDRLPSPELSAEFDTAGDPAAAPAAAPASAQWMAEFEAQQAVDTAGGREATEFAALQQQLMAQQEYLEAQRVEIAARGEALAAGEREAAEFAASYALAEQLREADEDHAAAQQLQYEEDASYGGEQEAAAVHQQETFQHVSLSQLPKPPSPTWGEEEASQQWAQELQHSQQHSQQQQAQRLYEQQQEAAAVREASVSAETLQRAQRLQSDAPAGSSEGADWQEVGKPPQQQLTKNQRKRQAAKAKKARQQEEQEGQSAQHTPAVEETFSKAAAVSATKSKASVGGLDGRRGYTEDVKIIETADIELIEGPGRRNIIAVSTLEDDGSIEVEIDRKRLVLTVAARERTTVLDVLWMLKLSIKMVPVPKKVFEVMISKDEGEDDDCRMTSVKVAEIWESTGAKVSWAQAKGGGGGKQKNGKKKKGGGGAGAGAAGFTVQGVESAVAACVLALEEMVSSAKQSVERGNALAAQRVAEAKEAKEKEAERERQAAEDLKAEEASRARERGQLQQVVR